jgi:hypothetical protein
VRKLLAAHQDLLLGITVVAAMSAVYLASGEFNIGARSAVLDTSVIPVVTCVARDPVNAGSFIARFGYRRTGGPSTAKIDYASAGAMLNYVEVSGNPLPASYGVPTEFVVGDRPDQFAVRALDSQRITWWLTSDATRSAAATSATQPVCAWR